MSLSINHLPPEVLQHVFNFIEDDKTLVACSEVCKEWNKNIISSIRSRELNKAKNFKVAFLKSEKYYTDINDTLSNSLILSLNCIPKIKAECKLLNQKFESIIEAHNYLTPEHFSNSKAVDSFVKADRIDRALELIDSSDGDYIVQTILEHMLINKHPFESILEKFKLLPLDIQSLFVFKNQTSFDITMISSFTLHMPLSDEKDLLLRIIFERILKENSIDHEKIKFLLNNLHSDINRNHVLFCSLCHVTDKEKIDIDLSVSLFRLFDDNEINYKILDICQRLLGKVQPDFDTIHIFAKSLTDDDAKDALLYLINERQRF